MLSFGYKEEPVNESKKNILKKIKELGTNLLNFVLLVIHKLKDKENSMEHAKELVINYDQRLCDLGLIVSLGLICIICIGLYYSFFFKGIIFQLIQGILLFGLFLYFMLFVQAIIIKKTKSSALIVTKDGLHIRRFGFVPWKDIKNFSRYYMSVPIEAISINVYDIAKLRKQATLPGSMSLFWTQFYNAPHISISGIDRPIDEVLAFAYRYYRAYSDNT